MTSSIQEMNLQPAVAQLKSTLERMGGLKADLRTYNPFRGTYHAKIQSVAAVALQPSEAPLTIKSLHALIQRIDPVHFQDILIHTDKDIGFWGKIYSICLRTLLGFNNEFRYYDNQLLTCKNFILHPHLENGTTTKHIRVISKLGFINRVVPNSDRNTLLHIAAQNGRRDIISLLIAAGANLNAQNIHGQTPLHLAAVEGKKEVISTLIEAGADVNALDNYGNTPLRIAQRYLIMAIQNSNLSLNSRLSKIQSYLSFGLDILAPDLRGRTPLHHAVLEYGSCAALVKVIISTLIEAGADVNAQTDLESGYTPLHFVALLGKKELISTLIEAGAEVNTQCLAGWTPLHIAARNRKEETVSALIAAGANVNAQDSNGETPLHQAFGYGNSLTVLNLILSGADLNACNPDGRKPYEMSAKIDKRLLGMMLSTAPDSTIGVLQKLGTKNFNKGLQHLSTLIFLSTIPLYILGGCLELGAAIVTQGPLTTLNNIHKMLQNIIQFGR